MFEKQIDVSGKTITLNPYSAARREALEKVYEEQKKWISKKPEGTTVDDLPIKEKAKFWKAKADVLWKENLGIEFFEAKEFEVSLLEDSETFFLMKRNYI